MQNKTTELECAKQWVMLSLPTEKVSQYVSLFNCDWKTPFTDEEMLYIFRKEVIEPWWDNVEIDLKNSWLDFFGTNNLTEEQTFFLFTKEVIEKKCTSCDGMGVNFTYDGSTGGKCTICNGTGLGNKSWKQIYDEDDTNS